MKHLYLFFILSIFSTSLIVSQEIYFDVLHKGKNAGFIKMTKSKEKKADKYAFISDFTLNKGIEIRIQDYIETLFVNDTMFESKIKSDLNGSNRFIIEQKFNKQNNTLTRTINNKPKVENFNPINFTYIRLFWEKPKTSNDVYSELFHLNFKIEINKNTISVIDNRNRVQKFFYDANGKLEKALLSNSIDDYEVVIKK
jgi:hypothetical protein